MADEIIFTTVHGSRLYGLDHAGSDRDSMIVYADKRKALHTKHGDDDVIHVGLPVLLDHAFNGAMQHIEGVFSHKKFWVDTSWRPMFDSFRIPVTAVRESYRRKIMDLVGLDTQKTRQHAVRLGFTLHDLYVNDGWFDPTLDETRVSHVRGAAKLYQGEDLYDYIWRNII